MGTRAEINHWHRLFPHTPWLGALVVGWALGWRSGFLAVLLLGGAVLQARRYGWIPASNTGRSVGSSSWSVPFGMGRLNGLATRWVTQFKTELTILWLTAGLAAVVGQFHLATIGAVALGLTTLLLSVEGPDPSLFLAEQGMFLRHDPDLVRSLDYLARVRPDLGRDLTRVGQDLVNGHPLADSYERHLIWLPRECIQGIRETEKAGMLDKGFQALADFHQLTRVYQVSRFKALAYPVLVFTTCTLVGAVAVYWWRPIHESGWFNQASILPGPTRVTLVCFHLVPLFLTVVAGLLLAHRIHFRLKGRGLFESWALRRDTYLMIVFWGALVEAGLSPVMALVGAARVSGRPAYVQAAWNLARGEFNGRSPLGDPRSLDLLPPDVAAVLVSALVSDRPEKTIRLWQESLFARYTGSLKQAWRTWGNAALVTNGLIWGAVVISLYLPLFRLAGVAFTP